MLVSNTPKLSDINKAVTHTGTGARTCEDDKDTKHFDHITKSGGVFIPRVVESLGFWSPFARNTLKAIASITVMKSCLRMSTALRYLMQQLLHQILVIQF